MNNLFTERYNLPNGLRVSDSSDMSAKNNWKSVGELARRLVEEQARKLAESKRDE